MPSPDPSSTKSSNGEACDESQREPTPEVDRTPPLDSPDQLARIADLVARGELPVPLHLPAEQLDKVVCDVRQHRRRRLVKFIARAIAQDIHLAGGRQH